MRRITTTTIVLAAAASFSLAAQTGPRRDGNWDITVEMDMPGMPSGMGMPPFKTTQCITPEEANDPARSLPQRPAVRAGDASPDQCKISDYKTEGNQVSWVMKCEGPQPMSGTGEFVYAGDTYTGTIKMDMARSGQPISMTMRYHGKRLGDCHK